MTMESDFALHPRLEADSRFIVDWPLSRVLLMDDARFPWLILVPRCRDFVEIHDLSPEEQARLMGEVAQASSALKALTQASKINIGALGNLVPQLHVHVVARFEKDAAWPGPVWGHGAGVRYQPAEADRLIDALRIAFASS